MQTYLLASSYLFLFSSSLNLYFYFSEKKDKNKVKRTKDVNHASDGTDRKKWVSEVGTIGRKEPVYRHASVSENMDEVKKLPTDTNHTAAEMDQNGPKEIGQTRTKKV